MASEAFSSLLHFVSLLHWKTGSMPKFLASCHYNKEEISRHLKKNIGYWPVQINGNKFATGQILKKPVEVVKKRILAWLQLKSLPNPGLTSKAQGRNRFFNVWFNMSHAFLRLQSPDSSSFLGKKEYVHLL
jgi:hypothetical protein